MVRGEENLKLRLYGEAGVVGLALIPLFVVLDDVFPRLPTWVKVGIAGGSFHLICEASGLNEWYLTNGVASRKKYTDVIDYTYTRDHNWSENYRFDNHRYY
jgi:hypothetical protein